MPRLSEQLKKELYLESLRKRVRHLYIYGESHPAEKDLIAAKLDGFVEAALLLQICGKGVLQKLIDEEHFTIFGISRDERDRRKLQLDGSEDADWSAYDAPAAERIAKRRAPRAYYASEARRSNEVQTYASAIKRTFS